jgi:hypothetical protein
MRPLVEFIAQCHENTKEHGFCSFQILKSLFRRLYDQYLTLIIGNMHQKVSVPNVYHDNRQGFYAVFTFWEFGGDEITKTKFMTWLLSLKSKWLVQNRNNKKKTYICWYGSMGNMWKYIKDWFVELNRKETLLLYVIQINTWAVNELKPVIKCRVLDLGCGLCL